MESDQDLVLLEETSPRDGIQNEALPFSIEDRVRLIDRLSSCGLRRIQVGSFVNPRLVPQMAGTEEVFERIRKREGTVYSALVLNERGLQRAVACGIRHVAIFVSASEAHSRRNTNCSVKEALEVSERLIAFAKDRGMRVQAGVMNAFGCRFEGKVSTERVVDLVRSYRKSGSDEISLADTAGTGHPKQVESLIRMMHEETDLPLSLHLHDTYGFGLANVYAAWTVGVRRFDTGCGGLGGCPFIPGAAGNVPTEDVVHLFDLMGIATGIFREGLSEIVRDLERTLGRALPGRFAHVCEAGRTG